MVQKGTLDVEKSSTTDEDYKVMFYILLWQ